LGDPVGGAGGEALVVARCEVVAVTATLSVAAVQVGGLAGAACGGEVCRVLGAVVSATVALAVLETGLMLPAASSAVSL
jgi:hypothetical protein